MRLRYTKAARADLLSLYSYYARLDVAFADRLLDRIERACSRLSDYPELGPARPDVGVGARILIIDRWLAIYRLDGSAVQIVRIVDGARDLAKLD